MLTFGGQDVNNAGGRSAWLSGSIASPIRDGGLRSPRGGPAQGGAAPSGGIRGRYLQEK